MTARRRDRQPGAAGRIPGITRGGPYDVLVAVVVLWILVLTLSPAGDNAHMSPGFCLVCGERGLANIIGNVLLFVPLGALLALGGVPPLRAVLVAALLSAGIELAQHWVPGRNPNPTDTIFNTLGAAGGIALVRTSPWRLRASGALRLRLGATALTAALVTILATGWLVGPGYPEAVWGQWTPERERLPSHPGRVLEARIGSLPVPSARLTNGVEVRDALRAGEPLSVHAVVGPSIGETWPIFRVAAGQGTLVVTVARRWDDLLIRFHTRAPRSSSRRSSRHWGRRLRRSSPGRLSASSPVRRSAGRASSLRRNRTGHDDAVATNGRVGPCVVPWLAQGAHVRAIAAVARRWLSAIRHGPDRGLHRFRRPCPGRSVKTMAEL